MLTTLACTRMHGAHGMLRVRVICSRLPRVRDARPAFCHVNMFSYTVFMRFIWDEHKNQANILKHGLDFADAPSIFAHPLLVNLDERVEYDEDRWVGIGLLQMRVVVIVFTEPAEGEIRIISLRKATSHERKRYEQVYKDELGAA